jgi:enoyl-CoA hydratase/carnithine racemase
MAYEDFRCLKVRLDRGVAFVVIDNPPINLFDLALMQELDRLGLELESDGDVRVVVFSSANPDFFIAHADIELILRLPTEPQPRGSELGFFHAMVDRYRTMPKATMAKIEGRARGGGSEFLLSLDMRFGAIGRCLLGQPEVALGIIPGGSGTQRLARLSGRSRALEIVLGCDDFDAITAERYGWINRALPPHQLSGFVDDLAYQIASFPAEAIALAKESVLNADAGVFAGLLDESHLFSKAVATAEAQRRMKKSLEVGAQTREGEMELPQLYSQLA